MSVRPIEQEDLPEIHSWWFGRGEGEMPDGILPPAGWLAEDWTGPIAAAFLYLPEDVPLGILDWMISRPGLDQEQARHACREVFDAISEHAKAVGCTRLFATVTRAGMLREARNCGFHVVATEATHLLKPL